MFEFGVAVVLLGDGDVALSSVDVQLYDAPHPQESKAVLDGVG